MSSQREREQEWAKTIKAGDCLTPIPLWNRTEGAHRQLATPTYVERVQASKGCQTGVMLTVSFTQGKSVQLDAGWFYPDPDAMDPVDEVPLFDDDC